MLSLVTLVFVCLLAGHADAGPKYEYDALGRMVSVTYDDGHKIIYTYDAAGNRTVTQLNTGSSNTQPLAVKDSYSLSNEQPNLTFDPRTNDSDPNSYTLSVSAVTQGQLGTVTLVSSTSVKYTPNAHAKGTDVFTYTISNGHGGTASATITMTLTSLAPVAVNDSISPNRNAAYSFSPMTNDSDPGGYAISLQSVTTPSHGTASIAGTQITYTPTTGYCCSDSFTYTIADTEAATGTATVTVSLINQNPVAVADSLGTGKNIAFTYDPRWNDSDPEGDALTVSAVATPSHGTASIGSSHYITYTPTSNYTGSDSFSYTLSDPYGGTATATESMNIRGTNTAPSCSNVSVELDVYQFTVTFDPRASCTDANGDALVITSSTNPPSGQGSDGIGGTCQPYCAGGTSITYTSPSNYTQGTYFTYTVSDGHGGTSTKQVNILRTN